MYKLDVGVLLTSSFSVMRSVAFEFKNEGNDLSVTKCYTIFEYTEFDTRVYTLSLCFLSRALRCKKGRWHVR